MMVKRRRSLRWDPARVAGGEVFDPAREIAVERQDMLVELEAGSDALARGQRSLAESLRAAAGERRRVDVHLAGVCWSGALLEANADLALVDTDSGPVTVVLDHVIAVRVRMSGPFLDSFAPAESLAPSLVALLREVRVWEATIEVGAAGIEPVVGRVLAVSRDSHVEVVSADGCEWLLALGAVGWVARRSG